DLLLLKQDRAGVRVCRGELRRRLDRLAVLRERVVETSGLPRAVPLLHEAPRDLRDVFLRQRGQREGDEDECESESPDQALEVYFELPEELSADEPVFGADDRLLGALVEEVVAEEGEADRAAVDGRHVVADARVQERGAR